MLFDKALRATVMTTELLVNSNVSKKILYKSLNIAKEFEYKYSAYKNDSLLSKINNASGIEAIKCTKDEALIFQKALEIATLSDGKFDPTIGALTQGLYGFGTNSSKIPKARELDKIKKLVNYKLLDINKNEIYLKQKGMKLDLGGIGKGYVADIIIKHLLDSGASRALVSVGGEICCFGKKYNIAIKNPFSNDNIAIIKSSKNPISISTSGDYERYIGSKEHHHILDSKSAKQNHYYSSVTLIKNTIDATMLDGVATIIFNSPEDELKILADKFNIAIIAITPQKKIIFENFSTIDIECFEIYPFK